MNKELFKKDCLYLKHLLEQLEKAVEDDNLDRAYFFNKQLREYCDNLDLAICHELLRK